MSILDCSQFPYDFTAYVSSDGAISMGTAVEFTTHIPYDSVPVVKAAAADTDENEGTPRSTYVGIARQAGAVGDIIAVRPWSSGTMPALVSCPNDTDAGDLWFWNGTAFEIWSPTYTDYPVDTITDNTVDEVYLTVTGESWTPGEWVDHEFRVIESGHPHEDEFYTVVLNSASTLTINTTDFTGWNVPMTIRISDEDTEGFWRHTAINMSKITGAASPQIAEFLIVKGGRT